MDALVWEKPIQIGTGRGRPQIITGPEDVLGCLDPLLTTGCEFAALAHEECRRALSGSADLHKARQATVAALLQARVAFV